MAMPSETHLYSCINEKCRLSVFCVYRCCIIPYHNKRKNIGNDSDTSKTPTDKNTDPSYDNMIPIKFFCHFDYVYTCLGYFV